MGLLLKAAVLWSRLCQELPVASGGLAVSDTVMHPPACDTPHGFRGLFQSANNMAALVLSLAFVASACGGDDDTGSCFQCIDAASPDGAIDAQFVPAEITEFLATVDGLTFVEQQTVYDGYRRFVVQFVQPLDHSDATGKTFSQRFIIHHRLREAPMVLHTSGYYLFSDDRLAELSQAMVSNQVDVEQRFFSPSTPQPTSAADWDLLRIEQAATDHHRLITALKPYYNGKWLTTGHSKGGMTSIYHRRFFPDDVDATVPYVAPISFAAGDERYFSFFDEVATEGCRQALRDVQRAMLTSRAQLLASLQADIVGSGRTFVRSGGIESALEGAIVGMPWSFFQSGSAADCGAIPGAGATDNQLYTFLSTVAGVSDDASVEFFSTYYHQAETELGFPNIPTAHLTDLLQFDDVVGNYLPAGVTTSYSAAAMADIDQWVKNDASQLLFVYGEFDPWYGGEFELGSGTVDSFKLIVAGANHGARITQLAPADKEIALDAIESWMGVRPAIARVKKPFTQPVIPLPPLRTRR